MDQRATPHDNTDAIATDGSEQHASSWLGLIDSEDPKAALASAHWDKLVTAQLGRLTAGISPAALALAYNDWLLHLALSPSRRERLLLKAWKKNLRWLTLLRPGAEPTIAPLPQDKRFSDPAWQRWPYSMIYQGFLLQQQWWHAAATGVPGMSQHHEDVVSFVARQWLDMVAPSNFILTNPVVQDACLRTGGMNLVRGFARLCNAAAKRAQSGQSPGNPALGNSVAVTPGSVIYRNHLIELIRYAPQTEQAHAIPLLVVPAWIMKYYILDLSPENSLVRYLVQRGHTVYMISWRNPDAADRELSLEDYREQGVMAALEAACADSGAPKINAAGYCLGGTLLTIAAAAMARDGDQRLNSLTLLAAQADFKEPGELSLFIDDSQVSFLEACMWNQGYLDTNQMAGAFQLLRSNDLIWSHRLRSYLLDLPEPDSDLMAWNADATRMPYRMHTQYLRQLFLRNDLSEGRYHAGGRPVALSDIRIPAFCVGTVTDHVAPWRSVFKLQHLLHGDVHFLLTSGGHNAGVVSPPGIAGRRYQLARHGASEPYVDPDSWSEEVPAQQGSWWPAWHKWLAAHSGKLGPVPPISHTVCAAPGTYVYQR